MTDLKKPGYNVEPSWGDIMYQEDLEKESRGMTGVQKKEKEEEKRKDLARKEILTKLREKQQKQEIDRIAHQKRIIKLKKMEADKKARLEEERREKEIRDKHILGFHSKETKGRNLQILIRNSDDNDNAFYLLFQYYCNKWSFFKTVFDSKFEGFKDPKDLETIQVLKLLLRKMKLVLKSEFNLNEDDYSLTNVLKQEKKRVFYVVITLSPNMEILKHLHPSNKVTDYTWVSWQKLIEYARIQDAERKHQPGILSGKTEYADEMEVYKSTMKKDESYKLDDPKNYCRNKSTLDTDHKLLNADTVAVILDWEENMNKQDTESESESEAETKGEMSVNADKVVRIQAPSWQDVDDALEPKD